MVNPTSLLLIKGIDRIVKMGHVNFPEILSMFRQIGGHDMKKYMYVCACIRVMKKMQIAHYLQIIQRLNLIRCQTNLKI